MNVIPFVFGVHFWPACEAALLFILGGLLAWPAVRLGPRALVLLPLFLFRRVMGLFGKDPGLMRMCGVIFGFNGSAMFLYMASGFRPWLPEAVAVLTGFNITVILLLGGDGIDFVEDGGNAGAAWVPGASLTALCGLAVLVLELPCFCFSIGMGLSLGREILEGHVSYGQGLTPRAAAYAVVILPLLLVSAVCEGVAILGMRARE